MTFYNEGLHRAKFKCLCGNNHEIVLEVKQEPIGHELTTVVELNVYSIIREQLTLKTND